MKKEGKEVWTGYFYSNTGAEMKRKRNSLISQIEIALDLGYFVSYNQSWDFVRDLEKTKNQIDDFKENGIFPTTGEELA